MNQTLITSLVISLILEPFTVTLYSNSEGRFATRIREVDLDVWFKLDSREAYKDGEAVMSLGWAGFGGSFTGSSKRFLEGLLKSVPVRTCTFLEAGFP